MRATRKKDYMLCEMVTFCEKKKSSTDTNMNAIVPYLSNLEKTAHKTTLFDKYLTCFSALMLK
jgi:hypothetical protein